MTGWAKIPQISSYMGLGERTVRGLLKQGLRHIRMDSGTVLIKYDWVDQYLESFEADAGQQIYDTVDDIMKGLGNGS